MEVRKEIIARHQSDDGQLTLLKLLTPHTESKKLHRLKNIVRLDTQNKLLKKLHRLRKNIVRLDTQNRLPKKLHRPRKNIVQLNNHHKMFGQFGLGTCRYVVRCCCMLSWLVVFGDVVVLSWTGGGCYRKVSTSLTKRNIGAHLPQTSQP